MSFFQRPIDAASFSATKPVKADLARGDHLFVGLNCYEPGQSQALHSHGGADKFYLLLSGKARMRVGEESAVAESGTLVWAPAGLPHGVEEVLERSVMVVGMSTGERCAVRGAR